jgi:hypothetical protein
VASVLASAIGQSGDNAEYFLNLTAYIRSHKLTERYLWELEREMLLCMCPWRARRYMQTLGLTRSSWDGAIKVKQMERGDGGAGTNSEHVCGGARLVGWGSNEYQQLESFTALQGGGHDTQKEEEEEEEEELFVHQAKDLCMCGDSSSCIDLVGHCVFPSRVVSGGSSSGVLTEEGSLYLWGGQSRDHDQLTALISLLNEEEDVAEGTASGDDVPFPDHRSVLRHVRGVAMGHEVVLVILNNGQVVSMGRNTYGECFPPHVDTSTSTSTGTSTSTSTSNCSGNDFVAHFLSFSPTHGVTSSPVTKDNITPPPSPPSPSLTGDSTGDGEVSSHEEEIVYLAAGVRQAVAVTKSGLFFSWGDRRYLPPQSHTWRPSAPPTSLKSADMTDTMEKNGDIEGNRDCEVRLHESESPMQYHLNVPIRILNASCGAKHTVLVDNIGRIWSLGDNSHGQLGRDIVMGAGVGKDKKPPRIDVSPGEVNLDCVPVRGIRWLKVCMCCIIYMH